MKETLREVQEVLERNSKQELARVLETLTLLAGAVLFATWLEETTEGSVFIQGLSREKFEQARKAAR